MSIYINDPHKMKYEIDLSNQTAKSPPSHKPALGRIPASSIQHERFFTITSLLYFHLLFIRCCRMYFCQNCP